ncbi:hypothetical protein ACFTAO_33690 [Paenibacillus rhizoplanae]
MSTLQVEIVDRLDEVQKREVARLYYQAFCPQIQRPMDIYP